MPVFWPVVDLLRLVEATGWCVVLMAGGYVVGWVRWGLQ